MTESDKSGSDEVARFSQREVKMGSMIIAIVITAIVVGAATAVITNSLVSKSPSTPTTTGTVITFNDALSGSEYNYINNHTIPAFEAAYPNITLKFITESPTQVIQTVQSQAASGNVQINVVGSDNSYMGALVSSGTVISLNKYMSSFEPMNSSSNYANSPNGTIIPAYYNEGLFSGTHYFFPFRGNVQLAFYNASAFDKAGVTWALNNTTNLVKALQLVNAMGGQFAHPFNMQGHGGASTPTQVFQWMAEFGGNPMYLNDTGDIKALTFLQNLSKTGLMSPDNATGYWGTYNSLGSSYQYIAQWPYVQGLLQQNHGWHYPAKTGSKKNLGIDSVFKGPTNTAQYVVGGDVLGVVKGSKNLWASLDLIHFLDAAKTQSALLHNLTWPVVNTYAYKNLNTSVSSVFSKIKYEEENGIFRPAVPWIGQWQNVFNVAWAEIMAQNVNVANALNEAHSSLVHYLQIYYPSDVSSYNAGSIYPSGAYKGPTSE